MTPFEQQPLFECAYKDRLRAISLSPKFIIRHLGLFRSETHLNPPLEYLVSTIILIKSCLWYKHWIMLLLISILIAFYHTRKVKAPIISEALFIRKRISSSKVLVLLLFPKYLNDFSPLFITIELDICRLLIKQFANYPIIKTCLPGYTSWLSD